MKTITRLITKNQNLVKMWQKIHFDGRNNPKHKNIIERLSVALNRLQTETTIIYNFTPNCQKNSLMIQKICYMKAMH